MEARQSCARCQASLEFLPGGALVHQSENTVWYYGNSEQTHDACVNLLGLPYRVLQRGGLHIYFLTILEAGGWRLEVLGVSRVVSPMTSLLGL